VDLAIILVI